MGDGSIISQAAAAAAADDDKASSSGIPRIVWFRQMIHRWQSSSSTATAKRSSIAGGDGDPSGGASTHVEPAEDATLAAADDDDRDPLLPRVVVVEELGPTHGHGPHGECLPAEEDVAAEAEGGVGSDSPMTPATPGGLPADVPRGCCPVYVGAERRRFVVPTAYLGMPVFRRLLEKAEEEFEFHYHGGALTIPCDTEAFKYILLVMDRHRQGLVDDASALMGRADTALSPMMTESKAGHHRSRRLDDDKLTLSTAFSRSCKLVNSKGSLFLNWYYVVYLLEASLASSDRLVDSVLSAADSGGPAGRRRRCSRLAWPSARVASRQGMTFGDVSVSDRTRPRLPRGG
ncbi:hypothetical protein HU200_035446 [Digitaria exilis]|uniref:Small auxin up regulated protein n=1 Tax=Digitaria exilis TaxID=1010633 RepID=A0A835BEY4_9POAL|nr:hypothetical protein HU200_035446 [Digitaria exilis]